MVETLIETFSKLFSAFFGWMKSPMENLFIMLFKALFGGLNAEMVAAFENPILKAICFIAGTFCWLIFIFAIPFYLLKIVKEEKRNWSVIFTCIAQTLIFVTLNQLLAKLCFLLPSMMLEMFKLDTNVGVDSFWGNLAPDFNGGFWVILALLIGMIGFLVITILRVGAMFIQILIAPFYVPYVLLGDHQKVSEWLLGTVAAGFTYIIQYTMFYAGITVLRYGSNSVSITNFCIGLSLLFGTFAVPKALQKFGWSSGAAHTFQSTASTVSMMAMRFMPRG